MASDLFDHLVVPFSYVPTPPISELERAFKGGVSSIFDGRKWQQYDMWVWERPGDCIVWLASPPYHLVHQGGDVIAWGREQFSVVAPFGYRPIRGHDELLDLHRAHPDLHRQFRIVALGSRAPGDDCRIRVAKLDVFDDAPRLGSTWFDCYRSNEDRFPMIPLSSP